MKRRITETTEETMKLGERYSQNLKGGESLCLYGELGSGKTIFTKGIARGLGVKQRLLSPTFIIVRQYDVIKKPFQKLYHLDLYRIKSPKEAVELGLRDFLNKKENIVVIEWPEKLGEFLPKNRIDIHFKDLGDNKREINYE
ncbi:tRNA (adenosine(37)-N6)-threonylcarbamoyltransferase complex ATPase subunit type 1 TsaE [Candidatus Gottesmanbacteria bacterium]|nr:tRNA (adenosine(37)-N6)-threonylcarbamoyltransferase complex ATPase subunit type 1 TsaE [Candidatus Gottesmanbacteria bacterium]